MAGVAARPGARARGNRLTALAAVALGLVTAVLVASYLSNQAHEQQVRNDASVSVVVAKKDIPLGTSITSGMLEAKLVTPDVAAASAFAQAELVVGLRARFAIPTGAQIVPGMVVQASSSDALSYIVPPGKRAMAITGSEVIGGGGHIRPGDFVDVMVTIEAWKLTGTVTPSGSQQPHGVYTILQNIEVLAVASEAEKVPASGPDARDAKKATTTKIDTVTLAVDPYQAQVLFLAESQGKLRLLLRPFGEQDEQPLPAVVEPLLVPVGGRPGSR